MTYSAGCRAPKVFQPLRAAAVELVELIVDRILLVEILVVFLGGVKRGGRDDLGDDRLFEALRTIGSHSPTFQDGQGRT